MKKQTNQNTNIMQKILSIFAALLIAFAAYADPVVLPAVLDTTNVSFHSEEMPYIVIDEGGAYDGRYFDMGPRNNSNDTLLYAEWDVTIEPIKYNIAADVYNTNSWRLQLYLLNQVGDTVKSLRYKGSSGDKGQFAIGTMDMSDLAAGNYKLRARAATAWSRLKVKDIIFEANYAGVPVTLPGALLPAYAELSSGASITNHTIAFEPETAPDEYATWNVSFARAGNFIVTIDMTASNGHNYGVALLSADGQTEIGAVSEAGPKYDTGVKRLGTIAVPDAGNYIVKLTNSTQWSEAVLNSIKFSPNVFIAGTMNGWSTTANNMEEVDVNLFKAHFDLTSAWNEFKIIDNEAWKGPGQIGINSELSDVTIQDTGDPNYNFGIYLPSSSITADFYWDATANKAYVKLDPATLSFNVVGNAALGLNGDPAEAGNDMTYNGDSTFTLVKSNVVLLASTNFWYKVTAFHAWTMNYGDPDNSSDDYNKYVNVAQTGTYNITFNFDWKTKAVSADAEFVSAFNIADGYYLIGNNNGWTGDWNILALSDDRLLVENPSAPGEYMITTTLANGNQFKVVWVENNAIVTWYPDGTDNNYIVDANHDGLMDVYFRPAGGQAGWHEGYIYATPAPYVRKNAVANKWGTICLPWNATIENAKAYYIGTEITVAPAQDATVVVEEVVADGELYAGKTYLIKAIADGDITANFNLNANKKTSPEYYNNLMGNLAAENETIYATSNEYDYYILSENAFHHLEGTASATVAQYKGYLRVAKSQGAPAILRIVEAENQATSIEGLDANETATKFIENGKLYILRDGVVYDAMGKMVK